MIRMGKTAATYSLKHQQFVLITIPPRCPALPVVLRCVPNVRGSHDKLISTTLQCMPLQVVQHHVPDVGDLHSLQIQMTTPLYLALLVVHHQRSSVADSHDQLIGRTFSILADCCLFHLQHFCLP